MLRSCLTATACLALLAGCGGVIPAGGVRAQTQPATDGEWRVETPPRAPAPAPSAPFNPGAAQPIPAGPVMAPVAGPAITPGSNPAIASGRPIRQGPAVASLNFGGDDASRALSAFVLSCPTISNPNRTDASGLTRAADWKPLCDAAKSARASDAAAFFARYFETLEVDGGNAFATGYFEPEIAGSRTRRPGYETPVYRRPPDLVETDLGKFADDLKGRKIRGRIEGQQLVPYHDRTAIEEGALAGRGLELAWVADPVEFFFLQVQGSGRLIQPDGSVIRIGYDSQNGHAYTGIGGLLRQRNVLAPGQASMQGIIDWIHANPAEGKALMRENRSFVFFREITGPGPLGAMGYAVSGGDSVAVDPAFVPMGAPVFLSMDRAEPNGLWVAQDTGGAIKGPNRFDTFWGAGEQARAIAGGMSAKGRAFILVPAGSFARLSRGQ